MKGNQQNGRRGQLVMNKRRKATRRQVPGVEVGDDIEAGQVQPMGDQKTGRRRQLVRNVRGKRASRFVVYGPTLSRLFEVH